MGIGPFERLDRSALDPDVCVVGCGPAGMVLAKELGRTFKVLVIERGDESVDDTSPSKVISNVGLPCDISDSRVFGLGGTASKWRTRFSFEDGPFGLFPSLDAIDLEAEDRMGVGWPIGHSELERFYERSRSLLGAGQPIDCDLQPGCESTQTPFLDREEVIKPRTYFWARPRVFTEELSQELRDMPNVNVATRATVIGFKASDSSDHVSSLEVQAATRDRFLVRARNFILAAGTIENTRLLLGARDRFPALAATDLIGRHFMEHPFFWPGSLRVNGDLSYPVEARVAHLHGDLPVRRFYTLNDRIIAEHGLPRVVYYFTPISRPQMLRLGYGDRATRALEAASRLRRAAIKRRLDDVNITTELRHATAGAPQIAHLAASRITHRLAKRIRRPVEEGELGIQAMAEQSPDPASRVYLSSERDSHGVPKVVVDWRIARRDLEGYERGYEIFRSALASTGLLETRSFMRSGSLPPRLGVGHHHMGTTRMSNSPERGVVDRDCRVHGVKNLFVAGSAVFPTGGFANPTLTILALAFRLADHCSADLR